MGVGTIKVLSMNVVVVVVSVTDDVTVGSSMIVGTMMVFVRKKVS